MSDNGKGIFRVIIKAPINRVWAELTRTDVVLPFFFNSRLETTALAVGAPVRMRSGNSGQYTGVVGEVLEFDPPHRYAHTFRFTTLEDPPCKVTYVLKEVEGGTEFTLINEDVPVGTKTEKYMTQGGRFIVDNLKALLETGRPTMSGRFALLMMRLSAPFTPAAARSENWPL